MDCRRVGAVALSATPERTNARIVFRWAGTSGNATTGVTDTQASYNVTPPATIAADAVVRDAASSEGGTHSQPDGRAGVLVASALKPDAILIRASGALAASRSARLRATDRAAPPPPSATTTTCGCEARRVDRSWRYSGFTMANLGPCRSAVLRG